MVTPPKVPGKPRPAAKQAPISLKDELFEEESAAEPVTIELVASPVETASAETTPVSVGRISAESQPRAAKPAASKAAVAVSVAASTPGASGSYAPELDPGEWSLKTLDALSENAAAVLDLAVALGKAESVSDALELQSRFASERYATLVRQTNEFVELTRRFALEASAPVRLSISAFVA